MRRKLPLILSLLVALVAPAAIASQGDLVMPTTGTFTGVQFSNLITQANLANASCNSGTSPPANATGAAPVAGQCWLDTSTTPWTIRRYDGAQWLAFGRIDTSAHLWVPPVGGGAATIASQATVDLCSVAENYITVTGTTTITSFGTGACVVGQIKVVRFNGALTLTHGANLQIQGSANITTANNDVIIAVRATSTRWDVMFGRQQSSGTTPAAGIEVPIGAMLNYAGFDPPTSDFQVCGGQQILRASFPDYVAAVTKTFTGITRSGTGLSGFSTTEQLRVGMDIEGVGIGASAQIASKTATTVTMTATATSSGTGDVTFFAFGGGNGTTTINVPDVRGRAMAGRDDMNNNPASRLTAAAPNACEGNGLGAACGNQQGTLTEAQLPAVNKVATVSISGTTGGSGTQTVSGTAASAGAHTHFTTVNAISSSLNNNITAANSLPKGMRVRDFQSASQEEPAVPQIDLTVQGLTGTPTLGLTSTAAAHTHTLSGTVASHTHTFSDTGTATVAFGSGDAHTRLQPTLVTNCIVRVK